MFLLLVGTGAILLLVFHIDQESKLDRAILAVTVVGSQGSGLVTAAMGVLRFQSKSATTTTMRPGESGDSNVTSKSATTTTVRSGEPADSSGPKDAV